MIKSKRLLLSILSVVFLLFSSQVHAQIELYLRGMAMAAAEDSPENNKTIMWFDSSDNMTLLTVSDVKKKNKEVPSLFFVNSNYKMIREFSYDNKPAFMLFRNLSLEGNNIGGVELYLAADEPNTFYDMGFAGITDLIYHDMGKEDEFCSIVVKLYMRGAQTFDEYGADITKKFYRYNQYRLDDDTANFLISFMVNERFYKNGTNIEYEETKSPDMEDTFDIYITED